MRFATLLAVVAFAAVLPGCWASKKSLKATNDRLRETRDALIHAYDRIKSLQASVYCHFVLAHNMTPLPNVPGEPPYPTCPPQLEHSPIPPPPPRNWP